MTTMTRTRSATPWGLVIVAATALWFAVAAGASLTDNVSVPQHALDRHGADAIRAMEAVATLNHGGQHNCRDGKRYEIAGLADGEWAVVIKLYGKVKTAFLTRDRGYLSKALYDDGCVEEWRNGHP